MADVNIITQAIFSAVRQIEITDPVMGGPNGTINKSLLQLANRDHYLDVALKKEIEERKNTNKTTNASINNLRDFWIGIPIPWYSNSIPENYIAMDGRTINSAVYPKLASIYGSHIIDMRAMTIRGVDDGRGIDNGRALLSYQRDQIQRHNHVLPTGAGILEQNNGVWGVRDDVWQETYGAMNTTPVSGESAVTGDYGINTWYSRNGIYSDENTVKNIAFKYICLAG